MMNTNTITKAVLTLAVLLVPSAASAYLNPYDVLLGKDILLPAAPRETDLRVQQQQAVSAERRAQEQAAAYAEQHPAAPEPEVVPTDDGTLHGAAPEETGSATTDATTLDPELQSLLRALERIQSNKEEAKAAAELRDQAYLLLQEEGLHSGAPVYQTRTNGLAGTGAGTTLAGIVMLLAIGWTLYSASRKRYVVHTRS